MTKSELISAVSEKAGTTIKDTDKVINSALEIIQREVATGNSVEIVGFGKFYATYKEEREGRNPQTGEKIIIAAHKTPLFKAGKKFKDALK